MSGQEIMSMTGFGRSVRETPLGRLTVEVRTLNSRYLEINVRSPRDLALLEMDIRALVRDFVRRGKVDLFLNLEAAPREFVVDMEKAAALVRALGQVASLVGDQVRIEHVLAAGEVMRSGETLPEDQGREAVLGCVRQALEGLAMHRQAEGATMVKDLLNRAGDLRLATETIAGAAADAPEKAAVQIREALARLEGSPQLDPSRLEAEAALLAQRADVTEEITRLRAHLDALVTTLLEGGSVGRRLDFLIQEIQREINTVGSKAAISGVSSTVVEFKAELEKVREQAQNLE